VNAATTIYVCTACRVEGDAEARPGALFIEALRERTKGEGIAIESVECLAVCKRPCTVAIAAERKWTYVIGDLDVTKHIDEVAQAAKAYRESEAGIVAWKERPPCFKKGVVSRTPPVAKA